uniref:Uncharacterized protein n=1 Tax=Lepeophtheirus salmonis TaxID=72036 RepID=A0A0K2UAK4_LEPSM
MKSHSNTKDDCLCQPVYFLKMRALSMNIVDIVLPGKANNNNY